MAAFAPKANFLFFLAFSKFAWGFGDQQPTQAAQESHETTDGGPETSILRAEIPNV